MDSDLLERMFLLGVGVALGYILARIVDRLRAIEEKVDQMDEEAHRDRNEGGFMEMRYVKDVLYLLVLVITLAGLWQSNQAREQSEKNAADAQKSTCEGGTDSRNATRDLVDAVYSLALGFTVRDKEDPPLTPQEKLELEAYIFSLDQFRGNMYDKIKPSDICEKYVEDDNVDPEPITIDDLLKQQGEANG